MRIEIVTPAAPRSRHGNRVTALRWEAILTGLGNDVAVTTEWSGEPVDVLVALHARRSAPAVAAFAAAHPGRPVVVALTGTDLYADLPGSIEAATTIEAATALVVLQERAFDVLPAHLHHRVHVIHQSVVVPEQDGAAPPTEQKGAFEVVVVAHLRAVKDPFLTAEACRLLPTDSPVRVTHLGAEIDQGAAARAAAEMAASPRYRWLGDVPRRTALGYVAASDLLVLTSRLEGGANAVSEALAVGTPVISTRIDGSIGLLGDDYPGYVEVGDAAGLAHLLDRAATDPCFLADLTTHVEARRGLVDPARERDAWERLLADLTS